jgi:glycosyltransferase involved in cell wall biosynthesis
MRILFLTPFLPSPPRFGGQRRMDGIMRQLAKQHEVSVLSFNRDDPWTEVSVEQTKAYCPEVVTLPERDYGGRPKRSLQLRSLGSVHSFEHLVKARRDDFQAELSRMLRANDYDLVQVEFVQMATFEVARRAPKRPLLVLDEHNVEFDVLKRTAAAGGSVPRRVYNELNWRKLAREERAAWRAFDGIVFTSDRDEQFVRRELPGSRTSVVPNGVDVDGFAPVHGQEEPEMLLFFGAINYFPNEDGVIYFIDQIFPKIRARRPNVRFCVVGPGAGPPVLGRPGNGVEILGMVDEIGPYIDRAAAVVVPLRIGGGTRLKIVEALSKQKAVVSTRLGAEGIEVTHEKDVLLADEPDDFAAAVERVLADAELRKRLGAEARELAVRRYSWQHVVAGLERFYETLK